MEREKNQILVETLKGFLKKVLESNKLRTAQNAEFRQDMKTERGRQLEREDGLQKEAGMDAFEGFFNEALKELEKGDKKRMLFLLRTAEEVKAEEEEFLQGGIPTDEQMEGLTEDEETDLIIDLFEKHESREWKYKKFYEVFRPVADHLGEWKKILIEFGLIQPTN